MAQRAETALTSGGAGRTDIWAVGVTIYSSAPVLGVGFANFSIAYTQDAVRASDVRTWNYLEQLGPHNLAIGTLIELGPIGLGLLALFVLPFMLRRGWGPDAAMIQAALASLLTLALFLDILSNRKQLWLIIGLAAGLAYVRDRRRAAQAGRRYPRPRTTDGRLVERAPGRWSRLHPSDPRKRERDAAARVTDAVWLVPGYPWDAQPVGGVFYQTQARALARRGLAITVAAPTPWAPWPLTRLRPRWREYASAPRAAVDEAVTVVRPRYPNVPGEPAWALPDRLIAQAAWRARASWTGARLVHGHSAITGLAAWRLARRTGLPLVLTFHGSDLNIWPDRNPYRVPDLRTAVQDAAVVITVSAALAARVESITGVAAIHLPLGSDHRSLQSLAVPRDEARASLDLVDDRIVVLFVGNMLVAKGVRELVGADPGQQRPVRRRLRRRRSRARLWHGRPAWRRLPAIPGREAARRDRALPVGGRCPRPAVARGGAADGAGRGGLARAAGHRQRRRRDPGPPGRRSGRDPARCQRRSDRGGAGRRSRPTGPPPRQGRRGFTRMSLPSTTSIRTPAGCSSCTGRSARDRRHRTVPGPRPLREAADLALSEGCC